MLGPLCRLRRLSLREGIHMALSPMMQQYLNIKEQYPDTILFFRLGDFYEMFFEDAKTVSAELGLTLTGRDCGLSERAPMCGVPYHAVDVYLKKLIDRGYRVAICEQMTDPALSKGLVEREVIRIVSAGTVIESNMLQENASNYIMSVCISGKQAGCAICDISTGEFSLFQVKNYTETLNDELALIAPSEILVNNREAFLSAAGEYAQRTTGLSEQSFVSQTAAKTLEAHFSASLKAMGFGEDRLGIRAAGALLQYLAETQRNALDHITTLTHYYDRRYMAVDRVALRNLELLETVRDKNRRGSLLGMLDKTRTAMGSRLLRSWIERPLREREGIIARQDAIEDILTHPIAAEALREELDGIYDIERLLSRIAFDTVHARDCLALLSTLDSIPRIQEEGDVFTSSLLRDLLGQMNALPDMRSELRHAIDPDAPLSVREGGIIAKGYSDELDELRDVAVNGKQYLSELEQKERQETGIKNLKIGYNRVFGYYIEVTKASYDLVPYRYNRKQTLANCERYITEELKALENRITGAEQSAIRLEYTIFCDIRERLKHSLPELQRTARALKELDVLLSLAQVSDENDYVRPEINDEGRYTITDGRHPVVEEALGRENFVPNDTQLDEEHRLMIITGPNMAGKSTYMRQVALIVLLAHMGCFVPAKSADIGLTDRIFTRIGASDDLYGGQSTFMVEMHEMATILRFATKNSLLLLDEVGRGTSTFDGLAIAWAAVEYIAGEKCGARTLFATHYHELSELEGSLPGVVNYRITAREQGEDVIFLRKIVPGGADRSFGVAVARLAGLPGSIIARARQIMARLEANSTGSGSIGKSILKAPETRDLQLGVLDSAPMQLAMDIASLDVVSMTPIDALNKLFELNERAKQL